ncbi:hypothetical protein K4F52_006802 [Lecanicillium sp. MT-2017a]|nr:hypothetical protein K4F52_006802 [Lecanicillium sp. MT-2017a]
MAKLSIHDLPAELLQNVAISSGQVSDITSMARTSRHFRAILLPVAYAADAKRLFPQALVWASIHGRLRTAEKAIAAGTNVNTPCSRLFKEAYVKAPELNALLCSQATPLMMAAAFGHLDLVRFLLDEGADARWMDGFSRSALFMAASMGHGEVVELLLQRAPDMIHTEDRLGNDATEAASRFHAALFRRMIEQAPPTLHERYMFTAARNGQDSVFYWLLSERGVPMNIERWAALNLMTYVCSGDSPGHVKVAETLLKACVKSFGHVGRSLIAACESQEPREQIGTQMARLVLDHGPDSRKHVPLDGALQHACSSGNAAAVELLLSHDTKLVKAPETEHEASCSSMEPGDTACGNKTYETPACGRLLLDGGGTVALATACNCGKTEVARVLLARGVDPDPDPDRTDNSSPRDNSDAFYLNRSPLHRAFSSGSFALVQLLISAGAVNLRGGPSWKVGVDRIAAENDDAQQVALLNLMLIYGLTPSDQNWQRQTPLHMLCNSGAAAACVSLLLSKGADCDAEDYYENRPLHYAAKNGSLETVKILVNAGADVNAVDGGRRDSPLEYACQAEWRARNDVVAYLIAKGADARVLSSSDGSLLHVICSQEDPWYKRDAEYAWFEEAGSCTSYPEYRKRLTELFNMLIEQGVDISHVAMEDSSRGNRTALDEACMAGNYTLAALLLEHGASPHAMGRSSNPPIIAAASRGNFELVKLLLSYGADVHARDQQGANCLTLAVDGGNSDVMVKLLLEAGAKFDTDPKFLTDTWMDGAMKTHHLGLLRLLLDNLPMDAVAQCVGRLREELVQLAPTNTVRLFVDRGLIDLEAVLTADGRTPFDMAVGSNRLSKMTYIETAIRSVRA